MVNKVKDYYENRFSDTNSSKLAPGIVSIMYNFFKKFEISRVQITSSLIDSGDKILDLGVGGGKLLINSKKKKKFNKYFGLDISSKVIASAKKNIENELGSIENFEFKIWDINNGIPYPDLYFDTLSCVAVLEHLFDPYFFISEAKRVLKKGGTLIIEVPNLVWLPRRLSVLFGKLPITGNDIGWDAGHLHYFTFGSLERFLKNSGFKVEKKTTSGIFCSVRQFFPSLLGGDIIIKSKKD